MTNKAGNLPPGDLEGLSVGDADIPVSPSQVCCGGHLVV